MAKTKQPSVPETVAEQEQDCSKRELPFFTASFHLPQTSWHEHRDWAGAAEQKTEFETFAFMTQTMLMEMTGGNNRLVVGYLGDMLNVLPKNLRLAMMHVLANGLGLDIQTAKDSPDTIDVNLVPRYEPLTPTPDTSKVGLVTPGGGNPQALIDKIKQAGLRG